MKALLAVFLLLCTAQAFAQSDYSTSLHATRAGKAYWYDQGFKLLTGVDIGDIGCAACHGPTDADGNIYDTSYQPGCVDCHPSGDFSRAALREQQCLGCHGRQAAEIAAGFEDEHRKAGLKCWDCHRSGEMHGDGTVRQSMFDPGAVVTDCVDCHTQLPADHASNDPHGGKLHCDACHAGTVISCYNCHFESQVDAHVKRPKQMISGFVLLLNREKDGKVGTGSFQSLTYKGKSFVAFGPYHGHTITRAGRRCTACHVNLGGQNEAIDSYNNHEGRIPFARWNTADSTLQWMKGVIPMPADYFANFKLDFLTYDGATSDPVGPGKNWSLVSGEWDGQHMLFATPLSYEQMGKLGFVITDAAGADPEPDFRLEQNHPNPFVDVTTQRYTLPHEGNVELTVHDALGRKVRTLVSRRQPAGTHQQRFDAEDLPGGVYFSRLRIGERVIVRKLLLLR